MSAHDTSVRKTGKSVTAACKSEECSWEVSFDGTDDAARAQAKRAAAVHAGRSARERP